jgi:sec-independent protein translocase protein TatC
VLTPPDVLSQFMLAIPLIMLYELGIVLAGFIKARSRAPDDDEAAEAGSGEPGGASVAPAPVDPTLPGGGQR